MKMELLVTDLVRQVRLQLQFPKGIEDAKKNLIKVPVINGTIPHEQVAKFGGAKKFSLSLHQMVQVLRPVALCVPYLKALV